MRLPRSAPLGGLVVDQDDKPVVGAEVQISSRDRQSPDVPHITAEAGENTMTDAEGRWRIDRFALETISPKQGSSRSLSTFQAAHPVGRHAPPRRRGHQAPRGSLDVFAGFFPGSRWLPGAHRGAMS
jgi:hypothetical protein